MPTNYQHQPVTVLEYTISKTAEDNLSTCETFDKQFANSAMLKIHMENHTDRTFVCSYENCDFVTNVINSMRNHLWEVHKLKRVHRFGRCPYCNVMKRETGLDVVRRHVVTAHNISHPFPCKHCNSGPFNFIWELNQHIQMHHRAATCKVCRASFLNELKLLKHMEEDHPEKSLDKGSSSRDNAFAYECKICGKILETRSRYRKHINNHRKGDKKIQCKVEGCTYKGFPKHVFNHMQYKHQMMCWVRCRSCEDFFATSRDEYLQHNRDVHGIENALKCEVCNLELETLTHLSIHKSRKHKGEFQGVFSCQQNSCKFNFTSLTLYGDHLLEDHKEVELNASFSCPVDACFFVAGGAPEKLIVHLRYVHSIVFSYTCAECDFQDPYISTFEDHCRSKHPDTSKPFQCKHCIEKFAQSSLLMQHHKAVHSQTIFQCCHDNCGHTFSLKRKIQEHMATQHVQPEYSDQANLRCGICHMIFYDEESHNLHTASQMCLPKTQQSGQIASKMMYRPKCKFCDKTFNHYGQLRFHRLAEHKDRADYHCSKCSEAFFSKQALNQHEAMLKGKCDFEKEWIAKRKADFDKKISLNKKPSSNNKLSLNRRPSNQQPTNCNFCDLSFPNFSRLKRHKLKMHKDKAPMRCAQCGAAFFNRQALTLHVSLNSVCNVDHKCIHCGEEFNTLPDLNRHTSLHHKDVTCDTCSASFAGESLLMKHKRTCCARFICGCKKAFQYMGMLRKHQRSCQIGGEYILQQEKPSIE